MLVKKVEENELALVEKLAKEIWPSHYSTFEKPELVDYLVTTYQSASAVSEDIKDGINYYLVYNKDSFGSVDGRNTPCGYFAFALMENEVFLSKLYLLQSARGHSLGKSMMQFVKDVALKNNKKRITLHVNANNSGSIGFYEKQGFKVYDEVSTDFGGGFSCRDFYMECALTS